MSKDSTSRNVPWAVRNLEALDVGLRLAVLLEMIEFDTRTVVSTSLSGLPGEGRHLPRPRASVFGGRTR